MIDCQPPPVSYRRAEVLTLPFKRRYEKIEIMPEVSSGFPRESLGEDRGLLLGCVRYGGTKEPRPLSKWEDRWRFQSLLVYQVVKQQL